MTTTKMSILLAGILKKRRGGGGSAPVLDGSISFSFVETTKQSIGIYDSNDVLVRTMESGVSYGAGTYNRTWDKKNDDGSTAPSGTYKIRRQINNLVPVWEGAWIGNTSTAKSGSTKHRAFQPIYDMCTSGTKMFYCTNYNEGWTSMFQMDSTDLGVRNRVLETFETSMATSFCWTDDNYVYWFGADAWQETNTFVIATRVSNNTEVTNFANGVSVDTLIGKVYPSTINKVLDANAKITGGTGQKTGDYLFVARGALNRIDVVNKNTGATVQVINTFTNPRKIKADPAGNLWVISGTNTVSKHTVNSDGTLASATLTISTVSNPLSLAISDDGLLLSIADGNNGSDIVRTFSNSTGAEDWTLGDGSYNTDPSVADNKFMFFDRNTTGLGNTFTCFLTYQSDGSIWVGDGGNYRVSHFNSSRSFINRFSYLPHSYSMMVCQNDPTRIFNEYMEFKIDYSKGLNEAGAWELVRNYRGAIPDGYHNHFMRDVFKSVCTFPSNGKTYGFLKHKTTNIPRLFEIPLNAPIREVTSISFTAHEPVNLDVNGDIISTSLTSSDTVYNLHRRVLNGEETWGAKTTIQALSPIVKATDPICFAEQRTGRQTTNDYFIVSNPEGSQVGRGIGYHLGAYKDNTWKWKASPSTTEDYNGDFPTDGTFDIGNTVEAPGAGGELTLFGNLIITPYRGEFWKQSQTNYYMMWSQEGLFLGLFGTWKTKNFSIEAMPELAGNSFNAQLEEVDGELYLFTSDESIHAGIHRWHIGGRETIETFETTITI